MHIASAVFVKSASKPIECPPETLPEFAVIGRSNVGKSSLINMLTQRSGLAKESTTPGKTQLINYFIINDQRYLVDLPGYGYAKSSIEDRRYWMDTTQKFFTSRATLRRIFVLVDGTISPQKIDMEFCKVLEDEGILFDIIMTKLDKATQGEIQKNLNKLKNSIQETIGRVPRIFGSSSTKGKGREEILNYIQDLIG